MSIPDRDLTAVDQLDPVQLIELLDRLDRTDERIANLNIDTILGSIDPSKLNRDQLAHLVGRLDQLATEGAELDLSMASPSNFARLIGRASKDQIDTMLTQPRLRGRILDEIFRRMNTHYRSKRAASVRAVVHWRFLGGADPDGYDRYESVLENGSCQVNAGSTRDPRVTITMNPTDFLKLITNNASAPMLFLTGKVKVKGDLPFAAGLTGLFDLPKG